MPCGKVWKPLFLEIVLLIYNFLATIFVASLGSFLMASHFSPKLLITVLHC